jgi:hypothetical protein
MYDSNNLGRLPPGENDLSKKKMQVEKVGYTPSEPNTCGCVWNVRTVGYHEPNCNNPYPVPVAQ